MAQAVKQAEKEKAERELKKQQRKALQEKQRMMAKEMKSESTLKKDIIETPEELETNKELLKEIQKEHHEERIKKLSQPSYEKSPYIEEIGASVPEPHIEIKQPTGLSFRGKIGLGIGLGLGALGAIGGAIGSIVYGAKKHEEQNKNIKQ